MKKKIFITQKNKKNYYFFSILFIVLLIIIFFFIISNNIKYFVILENNSKIYVVPDEKEGEKVKYLDKKSINNLEANIGNVQLSNIDQLNYTIQVFSDYKFNNINNYYDNLIQNKGDILNINEFYFFVINSEIGNDYFLTYKNFNFKEDAYNFCKNLSFIDKCLILNLQSE